MTTVIKIENLSKIFRLGQIGAGSLDPLHLFYSFEFMLVVVLLGTLVFIRVEQTFMDTV